MSMLARRYAGALMETVGAGGAERALGELEALCEVFRLEPDIRKAFENPGVPLPDKLKILGSLEAGASLMPAVVRFVELLVKRRRVGLLQAATAALRDLCDEGAGLLRARVTTARALPEAQVDRLRAGLSKAFGRTVVLEAGVRPDLIAGAQLQVGSTVYDGSVSGSLRALRRSLVKGTA